MRVARSGSQSEAEPESCEVVVGPAGEKGNDETTGTYRSLNNVVRLGSVFTDDDQFALDVNVTILLFYMRIGVVSSFA